MSSEIKKSELLERLAAIEKAETEQVANKIQAILDESGFELTPSAHIVIDGKPLGVALRKK